MSPSNADIAAGLAARPLRSGVLQDDELSPAEYSDAPKVLVVEDDFLLSMDIETALVSAGFDVVGNVKTAQDAVKAVANDRPHLAIMDIRLNGRHDGIDAALVMFRAYGVRCIFATGHADPQTRARAEPASPLGWLVKPFSIDALLAAVDRALGELKPSE